MSERIPVFMRYVYTVLLIAAVTAVKYFLLFNIAITVPFILYFVSVFIVAYFWGLKPAILAILCSTAAAVYFFMPPYNQFYFTQRIVGRVCLFLFESGIILFLAATIQSAKGSAREEQKRFKLLIEKSQDGLALFDKNHRLMYISPSVERVLGYTPEEYRRKDTALLTFPDERERIAKSISEVVNEPGKSLVIEHRFRHADGRWVFIETTLTNLLNEPGVNAIVSNFRDITDRMILELQREDFIGIVSHELKTPLTTIKGYLQLSEQHPELVPDAQKKIQLQVKKMERMIADLLDTTGMLRSKIELTLGSCDINGLIQDVAQSIQLTRAKQKIELDLQPLPPVPCDEHRITQVLTNLLTNAVKYSPENSTITIRSEKENDHIRVSVKDEGVGLTDKQKEFVFKRFYRAANNISGLGLGLFIAAQIIDMHKGKIGVESEEGKGSLFWFRIPLEKS